MLFLSLCYKIPFVIIQTANIGVMNDTAMPKLNAIFCKQKRPHLSHWMNLVTFELYLFEIYSVCRGFSVSGIRVLSKNYFKNQYNRYLFTGWLRDSSKSAWYVLELLHSLAKLHLDNNKFKVQINWAESGPQLNPCYVFYAILIPSNINSRWVASTLVFSSQPIELS